MGTWGTGIFQNDTTVDIWKEFQTLYDQDLSLNEIRVRIEKNYNPQNDIESYSEIWTGIAYGQWMYGAVEEYTYGS